MRIAPDRTEMMGVHVCRAVRVRPVCAISKYLRILPTRQSINRHQAHHDRARAFCFSTFTHHTQFNVQRPRRGLARHSGAARGTSQHGERNHIAVTLLRPIRAPRWATLTPSP